MGFNTTVVVINDALSSIEADKEFGEKLASAVLMYPQAKPTYVSARGFSNAALVIETHHMSGLVPVLVGGNSGHVLHAALPIETKAEDRELELARQIAARHGFVLRKKPQR